jgi:hypothetical protein
MAISPHTSIEHVSSYKKHKVTPPPSISLPSIFDRISKPVNEKMYMPEEVFQIISSFPEQSQARSYLIDRMISENLVPVTKRSIYRLLINYMKGNVIKNEWQNKGRPSLLG